MNRHNFRAVLELAVTTARGCRRPRGIALLRALCTLAILAVLTGGRETDAAAPAGPAPVVAITNVLIFDGENVVTPKGTVVIAEGKIRAAGAGIEVPAGAQIVDGAGATVLPGLIDSHAHVGEAEDLVRALAFGVTTVIGTAASPDLARTLRAEQEKGGAPGRADFLSAGLPATAPGGYGTGQGPAVPTLTRPEEARGWVEDRLAEGADYIQIMAEDGSAYGLKQPALDRATVAALVAAAHGAGKLAVVQIGTEADAEMALEAGADGLAHVFADHSPELRFLELVLEKKAFVIPTLTAVESTTGDPGGKALAADPQIAPYLTPQEADNLGSSARKPGSLDFHNALAALHQVRNARVPFLAGTDAPRPGTAHGASLHRELELLVNSQMTSSEALAAATSAPAKAFRLADRGRIAPGLRADLVMVQGYPATTITASRAILRVWKLGVEAPRVQRGRPAPKPPR